MIRLPAAAESIFRWLPKFGAEIVEAEIVEFETMAHLEFLTPSLPGLGGLAAVCVIAMLMVAMGAWVAGQNRRAEGDLLFGWAVVIFAFTVAGSLGITRFTIVAVCLALFALIAGIAAWRRDNRLTAAGTLQILLLAAPLIAIATSMIPTQWDEFTHWLPNARYLIEFDSVPRADLPENPAVMESYPYAIPLVMFMASRIVGYMAVNASAIFSLFLLLSFGLLIARIIVATACGTAGREGPTTATLNSVRMSWAACALGGLAVTILNPTFVTRLVFSAYADAPTAIAVGFAAVLLWLMTNALAEDDQSGARALAWQAGLACIAMVGLKQVNIIFLMALALALAILVIREPTLKWQPVLRLSARIFILPVIVYALWKLHVNLHIKGGEFKFLPYADWLIREIPQIIARMALIASKKGGYFSVMTVAVIFAMLAVWRPRGAFGRLAVISGVLFLSYNGFLLLAYVTAFGPDEGPRAASYWRYNTHLGGVCLAFVTYSAALLWHRYLSGKLPGWAPVLAIILVVALPIGMAKKLRFDDHPRYHYAWETGRAIAKQLTKKDRIILIDPSSNGQYLVIMRYNLQPTTMIDSEVTSAHRPTSGDIAKRASAKNITHVWVYDPTTVVRQAFGLDLTGGRSWLLAKHGGKWGPVASWPHPVQ
jgi:hypothetical protein